MGGAMRRRRNGSWQNWWRAGRWLAAAGLFLAIGYTAHQTGTVLARTDVDRLDSQLRVALAAGQELGQRNAQLQSELNAARASQAELQRRYDNEVPRGSVADLLAQMRTRMDGGVTTERVAQIIHDAEPMTRCDGPVISRRFRIGVEPRGAADDSTSFAEGMIRVRALVPSTATDLGQMTTITFTGLGVAGGSLTMSGLPARTLLALGNKELPLTVAASELGGFVTASLTTCRPG